MWQPCILMMAAYCQRQPDTEDIEEKSRIRKPHTEEKATRATAAHEPQDNDGGARSSPRRQERRSSVRRWAELGLALSSVAWRSWRRPQQLRALCDRSTWVAFKIIGWTEEALALNFEAAGNQQQNKGKNERPMGRTSGLIRALILDYTHRSRSWFSPAEAILKILPWK